MKIVFIVPYNFFNPSLLFPCMILDTIITVVFYCPLVNCYFASVYTFYHFTNQHGFTLFVVMKCLYILPNCEFTGIFACFCVENGSKVIFIVWINTIQSLIEYKKIFFLDLSFIFSFLFPSLMKIYECAKRFSNFSENHCSLPWVPFSVWIFTLDHIKSHYNLQY